jgi:hypothetical protein
LIYALQDRLASNRNAADKHRPQAPAYSWQEQPNKRLVWTMRACRMQSRASYAFWESISVFDDAPIDSKDASHKGGSFLKANLQLLEF